MQHFSRAIFKFSTWRPAMPDAFYPACNCPDPLSLQNGVSTTALLIWCTLPLFPRLTRETVCDVVASLRRCHIQSNSTACALTMCIRPALELAVPPCAVLQHGHWFVAVVVVVVHLATTAHHLSPILAVHSTYSNSFAASFAVLRFALLFCICVFGLFCPFLLQPLACIFSFCLCAWTEVDGTAASAASAHSLIPSRLPLYPPSLNQSGATQLQFLISLLHCFSFGWVRGLTGLSWSGGEQRVGVGGMRSWVSLTSCITVACVAYSKYKVNSFFLENWSFFRPLRIQNEICFMLFRLILSKNIDLYSV